MCRCSKCSFFCFVAQWNFLKIISSLCSELGGQWKLRSICQKFRWGHSFGDRRFKSRNAASWRAKHSYRSRARDSCAAAAAILALRFRNVLRYLRILSPEGLVKVPKRNLTVARSFSEKIMKRKSKDQQAAGVSASPRYHQPPQIIPPHSTGKKIQELEVINMWRRSARSPL